MNRSACVKEVSTVQSSCGARFFGGQRAGWLADCSSSRGHVLARYATHHRGVPSGEWRVLHVFVSCDDDDDDDDELGTLELLEGSSLSESLANRSFEFFFSNQYPMIYGRDPQQSSRDLQLSLTVSRSTPIALFYIYIYYIVYSIQYKQKQRKDAAECSRSRSRSRRRSGLNHWQRYCSVVLV